MLNLIVSEACNFGCQHCLHKCSVDQNKNHGSKKLMDYETAREAINKYAHLIRQWDSNAQLSIHFGSAEPLLNWEVVMRASEYIRRIDPNARIAINTNLSLMTTQIAKVIKQYDIQISTSLDGPLEGNDAIRTFHNGGGTYRTIMRAFEIMNDAGTPWMVLVLL